MQENNSNGNCIKVIPFNLITMDIMPDPLSIEKLCFWYNQKFNHPVSEETLKFFLSHVVLFGAIVFPNSPELGCIAINASANYSKDEAGVNQIVYKGELIYSRCR